MREVAHKIDWSEIIKVLMLKMTGWFKKVIIHIRDKYIPKKSCKVWFKRKLITKEVTKCRR